nr:hypothetical protein [Paenibacillus artemisiicola]
MAPSFSSIRIDVGSGRSPLTLNARSEKSAGKYNAIAYARSFTPRSASARLAGRQSVDRSAISLAVSSRPKFRSPPPREVPASSFTIARRSRSTCAVGSQNAHR